jgi:hypothetical protein
MENEMVKYKAGDAVYYGHRIEGGITWNHGVVLPYGGGLTLWILSDNDNEIHAFRRLKNGEYILATEKKDDPKQRLWMRKLAKSEISDTWHLAEFMKNPHDEWIQNKWDELNGFKPQAVKRVRVAA